MLPPFSALQRKANDDTWAGMITTERQSVLFDTTTIDTERNFKDNYDGTKATEVFYIPELGEHILSFLGVKDIVKATRISKRFQDTVQSSQKLHTLAFLAPTPQEVTLRTLPIHMDAKEKQERVHDEEPREFFNLMVNPLFFKPLVFEYYSRPNATMLKSSRVLQSLNTRFKEARLQFARPEDIQKGRKDYAILMLWIHRPKHNADLFRVEGMARDMQLAYNQPRSIKVEWELRVITREGWPEKIRVKVRMVPKLTAGGFVDVVNMIWKCLCDSEQNLGNLRKETVEGMAKRHGKSVMKWLETDVKVEINYPWWWSYERDDWVAM